MQTYYLFVVFVFGAIFGSFFNVVILRLPKNKSIIFESSHCPKCHTHIKPYDLIPIISYIFLGGKCRSCKAHISFRYPIIEAITAFSYVGVYLIFGFSISTIIGIILSSTLIIITMIDLDTMEIYDRLLIIILILAIINVFFSELTIIDHLLGFFVISAPLFLVAYFTGGIGGGDIKLIAVAGLLLGYKATIVAFFIASILGGLVAVYLLLSKQKNRKSLIAFGPYLCIGIFIAYMYGNSIINWYLSFYK